MPTYKPEHLDQLQREGKVFEYWSHAASYLPMDDYRFSLPRMRRACGERGAMDREEQGGCVGGVEAD